MTSAASGDSVLPMPSGGTITADMAAPAVAADLPEVPGYQILEKRATHGQGTVCRAVQLNTNRQVALKFLRGGRYNSPAALARFRREVELAARLSHPNITPVFEAGSAEGVPYYAMAYVEGEHLDLYVRSRQLGIRGILELMLKVCRAMQHAHLLGVIHRDLKPSNILVREAPAPDAAPDSPPAPEPQVLDFGLAKAWQEEEAGRDVSQEGASPGTPVYMSPEQAAGRVKALDTRTDVYSLGVVLFYLLTGEFPQGYSPVDAPYDVLQSIVECDSRRPRAVRRDIEADLEAVLLKALARDRDARYATAGDLANDIENYLAGRPVTARPFSPAYYLRLWARKHRPGLAAAAAVLIAAAAGGAYSYVRISDERNRAEAAADSSQRSLYFSRVNLAQLRYEEGDIPEVRRLLDLCPPHLRHWEWRHQAWLLDQSDTTIAADANGAFRAVVGPDGRTLLSCGKDGVARLWDARSGRLRRELRGHAGVVYCAALSPDGNLAVSAGQDGALRGWAAGDGRALWEARVSARAVETVAFTPNGLNVLCAAQDGNMTLCRARDGQPIRQYVYESGQHPVGLAVSPDGRTIAAGGTDGRILLRETDSGRLSGALLGHEGIVYWLAFSPDGTLLASACGDGSVRLWDLAARKEQRVLAGHRPQVAVSVAFSADGNTLASAGWDRAVRLWDVRTGRPLAVLRGHDGYISSVAYLPGEGRLVTSGLDGAVKLWTPGAKAACRTLAVGAGLHSQAAFAPDGRGILLAGSQRGLCVQDAEMLRPPHTVIPAPRDARDSIVAMAVDAAVRRLVLGRADGSVALWDLAEGRQVASVPVRLAASEEVASALAVSADGRHFVVGSGYGSSPADANAASLRLYEFAEHAEQAPPLTKREHAEQAPPLVAVHVWARGHGASAATFSLDGRLVAGGFADGAVCLYRVDTGQVAGGIAAAGAAVQALAFSPDGKRLASAGVDGAVRLWDAERLAEPPAVLRGHSRPVNALAFSSDGRRLISAGDDGSVRVWDVLSGVQTLVLDGEGGIVWSARFSPDGRSILTASADGAARLWQATP